jgi:hypothetical protein
MKTLIVSLVVVVASQVYAGQTQQSAFISPLRQSSDAVKSVLENLSKTRGMRTKSIKRMNVSPSEVEVIVESENGRDGVCESLVFNVSYSPMGTMTGTTLVDRDTTACK